MKPNLVPGRTCGACDVCCVVFTIDEPELRKLQGHRCPHLIRGEAGSCGIYHARPWTCRDFNCGWQYLRWVKVARPDQSGVLVAYHDEPAEDGTVRTGIVITLLNDGAVGADGLAETVAAGIAAEVPVYVDVPGLPGYTNARGRLNEALRDAVVARDKAAILQFLREAQEIGRSVSTTRVALAERGRGCR